MELIIGRYKIRITTREVVEEAFIEEVLGLKKVGDTAFCMRVDNSMDIRFPFTKHPCLEISKQPKS